MTVRAQVVDARRAWRCSASEKSTGTTPPRPRSRQPKRRPAASTVGQHRRARRRAPSSVAFTYGPAAVDARRSRPARLRPAGELGRDGRRRLAAAPWPRAGSSRTRAGPARAAAARRPAARDLVRGQPDVRREALGEESGVAAHGAGRLRASRRGGEEARMVAGALSEAPTSSSCSRAPAGRSCRRGAAGPACAPRSVQPSKRMAVLGGVALPRAQAALDEAAPAPSSPYASGESPAASTHSAGGARELRAPRGPGGQHSRRPARARRRRCCPGCSRGPRDVDGRGLRRERRNSAWLRSPVPSRRTARRVCGADGARRVAAPPRTAPRHASGDRPRRRHSVASPSGSGKGSSTSGCSRPREPLGAVQEGGDHGGCASGSDSDQRVAARAARARAGRRRARGRPRGIASAAARARRRRRAGAACRRRGAASSAAIAARRRRPGRRARSSAGSRSAKRIEHLARRLVVEAHEQHQRDGSRAEPRRGEQPPRPARRSAATARSPRRASSGRCQLQRGEVRQRAAEQVLQHGVVVEQRPASRRQGRRRAATPRRDAVAMSRPTFASRIGHVDEPHAALRDRVQVLRERQREGQRKEQRDGRAARGAAAPAGRMPVGHEQAASAASCSGSSRTSAPTSAAPRLRPARWRRRSRSARAGR